MNDLRSGERGRPSIRDMTHFLDFSNPMLRWVPLVLIGVVVVVALVTTVLHKPPETVSSTHVALGAPAPDFATTDPDGARVTLKEFHGHPLLINFWATWCTACQDEMPAIQAAVQKHRADHIQVLAVDYREADPRAIKAYLAGLHVSFRAALDVQGRIANAYGVSIGLPVSIFIDAQGIVRDMNTGKMTPPIIEKGIRAALA